MFEKTCYSKIKMRKSVACKSCFVVMKNKYKEKAGERDGVSLLGGQGKAISCDWESVFRGIL